MSKFSHTDYQANPGKYRLFNTAVVASHIFTNNGENDIESGTVVGIEFMRDAFNAMYRRTEPVYSIKGFGRHLYANCLADFVL